MSIYKSVEGEAVLRRWCEDQLDDGPWDGRRSLDTSLGPTHLAMAGGGSAFVLWLPGTNFNAATSQSLARLVDDRFRLCVADLPGQPGLSSPIRLGRDRLISYGKWLNEVVEQLPADRVLVAGHSLGAAVALSASPTPRIAGAALINPAGLSRIRITPKLLAITMGWLVRPSSRSAERVLRYMQHPSSSVDASLAERLALAGKHARQVGSPGPLPTEQVSRWRSRATVLTGATDPFFPPKRLEPASSASLDAPVQVQDAAGHLVPEEQPDRVVDLLVDLAQRLR